MIQNITIINQKGIKQYTVGVQYGKHTITHIKDETVIDEHIYIPRYEVWSDNILLARVENCSVDITFSAAEESKVETRKGVITIEYNIQLDDSVISKAIDEEGVIIEAHYSTNLGFVKQDMTSPTKLELYNERYPDGYELKYKPFYEDGEKL